MHGSEVCEGFVVFLEDINYKRRDVCMVVRASDALSLIPAVY